MSNTDTKVTLKTNHLATALVLQSVDYYINRTVSRDKHLAAPPTLAAKAAWRDSVLSSVVK